MTTDVRESTTTETAEPIPTSRRFFGRSATPPPGRRNDIVSKRNRPLRRLGRFFRSYWLPILLVTLLYGSYISAEFLNITLVVLGYILQFVAGITFVIIQFVAIFWFMSQTKIEIIRPDDPKSLTFDDYKGQERLVEMVKQWLSLLYDRTEFQRMGGRFINGLLLYGPPGTGKTLLAKCMAGEAGVAFISVEGSGFRGMFWGMDVLRMISYIRKARNLAREYGACIAFIDEIDAVGMSRGGVMGGQQTGMGMGGMFGGGSGALTRLLYEMDGVEEKTRWERYRDRILKLMGKPIPPRDWHVLFMGSTNRPDVLDPALTRPGRFDRAIEVGLPDRVGRREIIKHYLSKIRYDETVDLEALVQDTNWATPAKIMAAITKDAVRLALFDHRDRVSQKDIDKAFDEQSHGLERPIEEMPEDQRRQIAYHEAGHAVAFHYYRPEKRIVRATIIGRGGGVLGFVQPVSKFEEHARPLRTIAADIMVSLAGHVATKVFLGEYWTGAYSDFAKIRGDLVHLASLGYFGPPLKDPMTMFNGEFRSREMEKFWADLQEQCERFVYMHYHEVEAVAEALLREETLSGNELLQVMEQAQLRVAAQNGHTPNGHHILAEAEGVKLEEPLQEPERETAVSQVEESEKTTGNVTD